MYVGRIVAVGRNRAGANAGLYRVSSRSFPNRKAVELSGRLAILPREGHEGDLQKSPYIAYNCLRVARDFCVVTNGSHTDPIAEKIESGVSPRDALVQTLLVLDYEHDDYSTPRIAGVVPLESDTGWLGIVRPDALVVKAVPLEAGRAAWIATYEADDIRDDQRAEFDAANAEDAARAVVDGPGFVALEKPVTSAAGLAQSGHFELATHVV